MVLARSSNDSLRELNKLQQEFRDWLAIDQPTIKYDASSVHLRHHLHISAGVGFSEKFCAVFDVGGGRQGDLSVANAEIYQLHCLGVGNTGIEQSMLILVPKFIQDIQQVGLVVRPKWLQSLDDCARARIDAVDYADAIAVVIPIFTLGGGVNFCLGGINWESSCKSGRWSHFPNGVFESGARVTYDFTGDNRVVDRSRGTRAFMTSSLVCDS